MSCNQLSTNQLSTDDNIISKIDDLNGQLILDMIESCLQKSYLDANYGSSFWKIEEIYVITNEKLEANYRVKCEQLKSIHDDLFPTILFTCYRTNNCLNDIAVRGLRTKTTGFNILGDNSKGVTLCQHADIQLKAAEVKPSRCFLFLFACMSSSIARIDCCDQGKNNRCPLPGYDCHISSIRPSLSDSLLVQAVRAQIYFYDVNERGTFCNHPRQCLPLACVVFTQSGSSENTTSVPVKHFEVGSSPMSGEIVVDLTRSDETISLLDEAKGASIYNRLRRHFRKASSAEEIYGLSNYFPKPVDERHLSDLSVVASESGALYHKITQSSLSQALADSAYTLSVATSGVGQETVTLVTCQETLVDSLREKMMSQFCVKKINKHPSSGVPAVAVPKAMPNAADIISSIISKEVPSAGCTTFPPNTVYSADPTMTVNTVSRATFASNVQDTTITTNAMPRAPYTTVRPRAPYTTVRPRAHCTTVRTNMIHGTLRPMGVRATVATSHVVPAPTGIATAAYRRVVGQVSLPQYPRLIRYVPRILRPTTGLGGIRLLSCSNAAAGTVSSFVTSSQTVSSAMPTLHASNIVPLVSRPHSVALMTSVPSFNGGSNIRLNTCLTSNTVPCVTHPQSVAMMTSMPSFNGGSNSRPATASGGIAVATQMMPQWQTMLSQPPLQTIIPLYAGHSQVNLLSPSSDSSQQAQLLSPSASQQQFSVTGTLINPVSLISPPPLILHVPSNMSQFTDTRCADQPTASEQNLFFGGSEVEGVTIEDEGLVISGVRPFVIMPDGTCDEDEEQNCSLADGVQSSAETKSIGLNKVSDCDAGIIKMEKNVGRVRNQKSHTIILDADLPVDEDESNNEAMAELAVHRLVDQNEDGDLLDNQLRISDVVSLQPDCDLNQSSVAHHRLLGELWTENAEQQDISRPVENSLSSSNCKLISLGSIAVKNSPQVSVSLGMEQAEIVTVESRTGSPVDDCVADCTASLGLVASHPQVQGDAQDSESRTKDRTAESGLATFAEGSSINCGSQKPLKTALETVLVDSDFPKKQKSLSCDLNKLPVSGLQKRVQPIIRGCLPASEDSTKEANAKQKQAIPVFTVCADGSVSVRLDTEPEVNEDKQDVRNCNARIELLKDVDQKDTLMQAIAKVLGNIHVTDLRNSSDEIVYRRRKKNTKKITSRSLNLQQKDLSNVNGIEQATGIQKDPYVRHKPSIPNCDKNASDTDILIESVQSMDLEQFDEISKSPGKGKHSKRMSFESDEAVKQLNDRTMHVNKGNSVGSMNISDFEENDVENDEPFQNLEDGTETFSSRARQMSQRFRQQSQFSDPTCSAESSNDKSCGTVSVNETFTHSATKNHSKSCEASAKLPFGSENRSVIYNLNKRPFPDSIEDIETFRIRNKEMVFESENLSSKDSHSVSVCEEERSIVCEELISGSNIESEMSKTKTHLLSVNTTSSSQVVDPLLLDSPLETCRMNEPQLMDVVNESETCNMNKKQLVGLDTESETRGINNEQSLVLANESKISGINQELTLEPRLEYDSIRTCKELPLHTTNEHNAGITNDSEICGLLEEQRLDVTDESETCRIHEETQLDVTIETESCRAREEQHLRMTDESDTSKMNEDQQSNSCRTHAQQLSFANESDTRRTHEGQQLDVESELESSRTQDGQHLDLANESYTSRMRDGQRLELGSELESSKAQDGQHLDLENESDTCRMREGQRLELESELESSRRQDGHPVDLETESDTSRMRDEQQLELESELEPSRTQDGEHLDLANESDTCRLHEGQQLELESELESSRRQDGHPVDLETESDVCRMHEDRQSESCKVHDAQHLDLVIESELSRPAEEQQSESSTIHDLELVSKSELCRTPEELYLTPEELYLDVSSDSESCITLDGQVIDLTEESETCRMHEEQHIDMPSDSDALGIDKQMNLEIEHSAETFSLCEGQHLKVTDELPNTGAFKKSPLKSAIELGESGVNGTFLMANAGKTVSSNFKNNETLMVSCHNPVSPVYVNETISPISPACSVEETSFAYVTEATSSACVSEAILPGYVTEAILPGYATEAISPVYVTEAISPAYITEPISPAYVIEPISPVSCTGLPVSPTSTYRPVTENVSPPCQSVTHTATGVHERNSLITSDEFQCSSGFQRSDSDVNFISYYISSDSSTSSNAIVVDDVPDELHSGNHNITESEIKYSESDSVKKSMTSESVKKSVTQESTKKSVDSESVKKSLDSKSVRKSVKRESKKKSGESELVKKSVDSKKSVASVSGKKSEESKSIKSESVEKSGASKSVKKSVESKTVKKSVRPVPLKESMESKSVKKSMVSESMKKSVDSKSVESDSVKETMKSENLKKSVDSENMKKSVDSGSVKKSVELNFEPSHQTSHASEMNAVTRKKRVLSLEDYKKTKLKGRIGEVENRSNSRTPEIQTQNMNLNQMDQEKGLVTEGSCQPQSVTFGIAETEEGPSDQAKIINSVTSLDMKLSENAMEKTPLIDLTRPRDPRLQGRSIAFENTGVTWNNNQSEMEKELELDGARMHTIAHERFADLNEDVMEVETQYQLARHLETEKDNSSSQHIDESLSDTAVEDMNGMARGQMEIELIGGDKEQDSTVTLGYKVIEEVTKDVENRKSGLDGKERGKIIEDVICITEAEADTEQVVNEKVIEVLDDWDECGDFVIVGSDVDVLSDDRDSGDETSDFSDEFGDLVVLDGADDEDEACRPTQMRESLGGETDQEHVWHLLDDALTIGDKSGSEDNAPVTVEQQHLKDSDKTVQKKRPVIVKSKGEIVKNVALDGKGDSQVNAGTELKENIEGTKVVKRRHYHKRKSPSRKSYRPHRTRRNDHLGNYEFRSEEHSKISHENYDYHQPREEQQRQMHRWDTFQGDIRELSLVNKRCMPIDIELIKVLRNVDDISSERSIIGGADSFVTLLMKEYHHLPEENQRYYSECIRQTLLVDKEFVTSEHIYGNMAELLTEEQRQHIQHTNISPIVARELHLEDILKKVKLELDGMKSEGDCDQEQRNLLLLTKEMLYDQMNDLKCYQKSRSVFVLPDEFRLPREYGKYISVDGSLLFLSKSSLSVKKCCMLYCFCTEIEEMEDELDESLGDARLTEEICRKLSVLYLKRKYCLQEIGCSADQVQTLKKRFSKHLSWFRRRRVFLNSKDTSKDGQEQALVNCLNQRIEKLKEYLKVITSLKNVSGVWFNSERKQNDS